MAVGRSRKADEGAGSIAPGRENSACRVEGTTAERSSTKGVNINIARHCAFWSFLSFLWPVPETPLSPTMTLRAPWNPEQNKELLSDQLSYNERMTPGSLFMHPAQSSLLSGPPCVSASQSATHFTIIPHVCLAFYFCLTSLSAFFLKALPLCSLFTYLFL